MRALFYCGAGLCFDVIGVFSKLLFIAMLAYCHIFFAYIMFVIMSLVLWLKGEWINFQGK